MCMAFKWQHGSLNNKPSSFCTWGDSSCFIDCGAFSWKVFLFCRSKPNATLWMRAFVGESLTALYSKCFYSWRIEAGLCFHWNRRHPKEKYTKIVPLESSAVYHNISLFGSSFIFVSPHPQFPSHPVVILHEPFVACVLQNETHMRRQRWVCVVFLTYTNPVPFIRHWENYSQIVLERMNRNCLFHFTANLWQMFWRSSRSH